MGYEYLQLIHDNCNIIIRHSTPGGKDILLIRKLSAETIDISSNTVKTFCDLNIKPYGEIFLIDTAIIGKDTELRPGAFLRGNVIVGEKCVVGNSSELKNCILLNHVQVPHYNYVGDSILGDYAHMGAGSILSNLKSGGKNIVIHGDKEYETGLRKIGGFLGEHADIGCGSVLNPGTIIGKNTQVYPLSMLRGCFPENSIVKSQDNVVDKRLD